MIVLGTLSGIQDYLFTVHDVGGGQARALRARSFRIQVISECISRRLLGALGLPGDRIVLRAAAKFAIAANGPADQERAKLEAVLAEIHRWLLLHTQGRLRLAVGVSDSNGTDASRFSDAQRRLQRNKLTPWGGPASGDDPWSEDRLVVPDLYDQETEARRDHDIGVALTRARHLHLLEPKDGITDASAAAGQTEFEAGGLRVRLAGDEGTAPDAIHSEPIGRFALHVPTDDRGQMVEFLDLAGRSRGTPMLGVLKADADGLGKAVGERLGGASSLEPLQELSDRLNEFFGRTLEDEMRDANAPWRKLYTVFSGGDDVLLVGPWDIAIDFAAHIERIFQQLVGSRDSLTISAGLAIVKPRFPMRLAARQAERSLEEAKTRPAARADAPKDQFAALGGLWKWKEHEQIIAAGKQLAEWVDSGIVQRGWLHTLLELAILRRGEMPARSSTLSPARATARLAYHVGRNWPRQDEHDGPRLVARTWIDAILGEFDRYESTSHTETVHLPVIVRYALLATGSASQESQP